jgi:hypothetical protein
MPNGISDIHCGDRDAGTLSQKSQSPKRVSRQTIDIKIPVIFIAIAVIIGLAVSLITRNRSTANENRYILTLRAM